jgi:threonine dehydratase
MSGLKDYPVGLREMMAAEKVVRPFLKETNLSFYQGLSDLIGAEVFVKHENHNIGGSFKIRGGLNLMHHIRSQGIKGVITFSTGNHGISVALAAKTFGVTATVVVPTGNNPAKNAMIQGYGATLIERGQSFEEASAIVSQISKDEGLYFVHAANEPHLINGVGIEFLEIIRDLPSIDAIILPIGAGSEIAAATVVLKSINPKIEIIAVQAEQSPAAYLSWHSGEIVQHGNRTFAGGFATGSGYALPFGIYKDSLSDFVLLTENEIEEGMANSLRYTRNLAEGAGAAPIQAAIKIKDKLKGKKVVLQMSGGNAELPNLKRAMETTGFS